MTFDGWPPEAYDVLARLEGDPTPSEREAVRADRERLVRAPMVALLDELAERDPAFADHAVWRYATGVRAWQRQGAAVRWAPFIELGIAFDLDGLWVQGGWWPGSPTRRERYRAAVAGRPGARLARIVADLEHRGHRLQGDQLVRVPRGYPADHRRAGLLRYRSLFAVADPAAGDWLHGPEAADHLQAAVAELRPLLDWLTDHLAGPEPL